MAGLVDWTKFVQKVYEAFDKKVNDMLYEAVMAAGDKVLPEGRFSKTFELVAANRESIIELVDDIASLNGTEAVIMGTKPALAKLSKLHDVDWISDRMKDERNSTGRLGVWEGITLVELPQAFAPNSVNTKMVDNNRLLVMPLADNKFIKMYDEGEALVREITDKDINMDMTYEFEYQQKMGVATVINRKFGQIKFTA